MDGSGPEEGEEDRELPDQAMRLAGSSFQSVKGWSHSSLAQAGGFSRSLGNCPCVPNSRWLLGSVALPLCGQACAQAHPGGVGSGRDCRRRWSCPRLTGHRAIVIELA